MKSEEEGQPRYPGGKILEMKERGKKKVKKWERERERRTEKKEKARKKKMQAT